MKYFDNSEYEEFSIKIKSDPQISGLQNYFEEIFFDLSSKSSINEDKYKGLVTKIIFIDFMSLPLFISEKIFYVFDKDKDGSLNLKEFTRGMLDLYGELTINTKKTTFDIFDFDKDRSINYDDIIILLSYFILGNNIKASDKIMIDEDTTRIKIQKQLAELEELIKQFFMKREKLVLNFEEYLEMIEYNDKYHNNIFLLLLNFIHQSKPFDDINIEYLERIKNGGSPSKNITKKNYILPKDTQFKISPKRYLKGSFSQAKMPLIVSPQILGNKLKSLKEENSLNAINFKNRTENLYISAKKLSIDSPSRKINTISSPKIDTSKLQICNKKKELNPEYWSLDNSACVQILDNSNSLTMTKSIRCLQAIKGGKKEIEISAFKLSKSQKLKEYKLIFLQKEMFYFKEKSNKNPLILEDSKKFKFKGLHTLQGTFPEILNVTIIDEDNYYPMVITSNLNLNYSRKQVYFFKKGEDLKVAADYIKKVLEIKTLEDEYDVRNILGKGQFGEVKKGIHKITKEKYAIKIIKKYTLDEKRIEIVKREIDIMKCLKNNDNPNIVKLNEICESSKCIYIIMEYLPDGNLHNHLTKFGQILKEQNVKDITRQIVNGLMYLHKYGIVHRDLKFENILVSKSNNEEVFKIVDFGLSKIMGKNETTREGYGSLCYTAPEILLKKSYGHHIDIWSFGIILYFLHSGLFPFDDKHNCIEKIASQIVNKKVDFPINTCFLFASDEVKELIKNCLNKNVYKRYDVNRLLLDEWFLD